MNVLRRLARFLRDRQGATDTEVRQAVREVEQR